MEELRFEKLKVYQKGLELVDDVIAIAALVPRGKARLVDHAERASWSTVLNTAEGCTEYSRSDKNKFLRYACRSAGECIGVFTILLRYPGKHVERCRIARERARELVRMLTRMIIGPATPSDRKPHIPPKSMPDDSGQRKREKPP